MFDFDGTLFKSWEKTPPWWDDPGPFSFFVRPESLGPPCVPEHPPQVYWTKAVRAARAYIKDAGTFTMLVTGRVKAHSPRVHELLSQVGLTFDRVLFNPGMSASTFKKKVLGNYLAVYNTVSKVEIWENENQDHYNQYLNVASNALERDVDVVVHNVRVPAIPLTCGAEDFAPSTARVVEGYLSRR